MGAGDAAARGRARGDRGRPARLRRLAAAARARSRRRRGSRRRSRPGWPPHGVEDFDVAGNSLGGWVALELALAGRARSVVGDRARRAVAGAAAAAARLRARGRAAGGAVRRGDHARAGAAARRDGDVRRPPRADARRRGARPDPRLRDARPASPRSTPRCARTRSPGSAEIRVPVTLAWPEHDRMVARLRHPPPNVRTVILPGTGHLPMWDDPQLVAELLRGPLRSERAGSVPRMEAQRPSWRSRSTASGASSPSTRGRRCSTCCASSSSSRAPRRAATTASAAPARCWSTAAAPTRACCSRSRCAARSRRSRASPDGEALHPRAAGVRRARRVPVRLLHAGPDLLGGRHARRGARGLAERGHRRPARRRAR